MQSNQAAKILLILVFGLIFLNGCATRDVGGAKSEFATVKIGSAVIKVEVARSFKSQADGLGGRSRLVENEGMLFVFETPAVRKFWMKDMKFALDLIFIDDNEVVDLAENLPPPLVGEKPAEYQSLKPANYVLEISAGFAANHQVKEGDMVDIIW